LWLDAAHAKSPNSRLRLVKVRPTGEIGIRIALGADRGNVMGMVLKSAIAQAGFELCIAVPIAMLCGKLLQHQIYEVNRFDPMVLGAATLVLALCAMVAAIVPARRAASVDRRRCDRMVPTSRAKDQLAHNRRVAHRVQISNERSASVPGSHSRGRAGKSETWRFSISKAQAISLYPSHGGVPATATRYYLLLPASTRPRG
jgi:hypothetical protein